MKTHKLETDFIGIGEVKGFHYRKVRETVTAYLYLVKDENSVWYEVFKKKATPICLDFSKRIYSETELKKVYPKSKDFGVWAWTFKTLVPAGEKLLDLMTTPQH